MNWHRTSPSFVMCLALGSLLAACGLRDLPTPAAALAAPTAVPPLVILAQLDNVVHFRPSANAAFVPATQGQPLTAGAELQTSPGARARLDLPDGTFLRLGPDTNLSLFSVAIAGTDIGTTVRLSAGLVWSSRDSGAILVSTPAGIATLRPGRAAVEFLPGRPDTTSDDSLRLDCLEGPCTLWTEQIREELTDREQIIVTGGVAVRAALTDEALAEFARANPESAVLVAQVTPTQAVVVTATSPAPVTEVVDVTPAVAEATPTPPAALLPTQGLPAPTAGAVGGLLGTHIVQAGETMFCIGRGYAVQPVAIAVANDTTIAGALTLGQVLDIPAVEWVSIPPGPACPPQFASPYLGVVVSASATPAVAATALGPVVTATSLPDQAVWAPPVNLSQSGDALRPAIAVDRLGNYYALWWDNFSGARLALFQPGGGWQAANPVPLLVGGEPKSTGQPIPPATWHVLTDSDGFLHAFWIDTEGSLFYARRNPGLGEPGWTGPTLLAHAVSTWEVTLASDAALHLALIRSEESADLPPGVYYLRRPRLAGQWDAPQPLAVSLYFRSQPAPHVTVAALDSGQVLVGWDDPQLLDSRLARSTNAGQTFEPAVPLAAPGSAAARLPSRLRWLPLPGGSLLRLWTRVNTCEVYQEQYLPAEDLWTAPVRVQEDVPGCLASAHANLMADGRLALWTNLGGSAPGFTVWDGRRWSPLLRPRVSFVDPATTRLTTLACVDAAFSGEQLVVVGCDERGDVWATTSNLALGDLLPALASAWRPLESLSSPDADAGPPAFTRDAAGTLHALWTQTDPDQPGEQPLFYYARRDGDRWSAPAQVLELLDGGPVHDPLILADPRGWLHAVWSGGPAGRIFYSRAFTGDGLVPGGWSLPRALPARQPAGGSPAMFLEPSGRLVVVYTVPLNEERGLYLTASSDAGLTWSEPTLVLDAVAAGWPAVPAAALILAPDGRLHVLVVRGSLPPATLPLGVYYTQSADGGQTWSPLAQVGTEGTGYPRLAAAANGDLHRFWVQTTQAEEPVWHQWSRDAGVTWSVPNQVPALRAVSFNLSPVLDADGTLYLTGVESTRQDSAALFYLRWTDGQWLERETIPLGQTADAFSGASALLLASGHLGVLYQVNTTEVTGSPWSLIGYTERSLPPVEAPAPATAVPTTPPTVAPGPAPTEILEPTRNPTPNAPVSQRRATPWLQVGAIAAAMLGITTFALLRLRAETRPRYH